VAHYVLATTGLANLVDSAKAGGFSFVQGATSASANPVFVNFGFTSPHGNPPSGCGMLGLCFSESFDVSSPMRFGVGLPVGAGAYLMSDGFGELPVDPGNGSNAQYQSDADGVHRVGFAGNVVGHALARPQNQPWPPVPEPVTWRLVLAGSRDGRRGRPRHGWGEASMKFSRGDGRGNERRVA